MRCNYYRILLCDSLHKIIDCDLIIIDHRCPTFQFAVRIDNCAVMKFQTSLIESVYLYYSKKVSVSPMVNLTRNTIPGISSEETDGIS